MCETHYRSPLAGSFGQLAAPAQVMPVNAVRDAVQERRFSWTMEYIPSSQKALRDDLEKVGEIASAVRAMPLIVGMSVTDRVVSDRDPDPVAAASDLLARTGKQPLVHFSGKNREVHELVATIRRMRENGLENALLITGDRVHEAQPGFRTRYLESVPAIQIARKEYPELLIAAAVNPFKYREEDAMAQYLKMGKKIRAGTDLLITQVGFDPVKHEELLLWMAMRQYFTPVYANLMPINAARARYIRAHQLAGVTITDSFLSLLEEEERVTSDKGAARSLRRLALQILGARYFGYAGVQLTGIHSVTRLRALQSEVRECGDLCPDKITWRRAWDEACSFPKGGRAVMRPSGDAWFFVSDQTRKRIHTGYGKYLAMRWIHDFAFGKGFAASLFGKLVKRVRRSSAQDRVLVKLERSIKSPLFGCETCGSCRLAQTQYVCPETCPKGLANGPCGGTTENLCEFRDRECIHSHKYRIAKAAGRLDELESILIPAVPATQRGTSSWPPHFRGEPASRTKDPMSS